VPFWDLCGCARRHALPTEDVRSPTPCGKTAGETDLAGAIFQNAAFGVLPSCPEPGLSPERGVIRPTSALARNANPSSGAWAGTLIPETSPNFRNMVLQQRLRATVRHNRAFATKTVLACCSVSEEPVFSNQNHVRKLF
jgi:hypothetical protein